MSHRLIDGYGIYFFKEEHRAYGWAGADHDEWSKAAIRAIDYRTGKIRWSHDVGEGTGTGGVLTTATGLTFTGDAAGNALALHTSDGATLWHSGLGLTRNSPIAYKMHGREYIPMAAGSSLCAWTLPEAPRAR